MPDRKLWNLTVQPIQRVWPDPTNDPDTFTEQAAGPRSLLVLAGDDGLAAFDKVRTTLVQPEPVTDEEGWKSQVVAVQLVACSPGQSIDVL